jgi:uncharacterized membrane protein
MVRIETHVATLLAVVSGLSIVTSLATIPKFVDKKSVAGVFVAVTVAAFYFYLSYNLLIAISR